MRCINTITRESDGKLHIVIRAGVDKTLLESMYSLASKVFYKEKRMSLLERFIDFLT